MSTDLLLSDGADFDAGMSSQVDQETVEATGPQFPMLQWCIGDVSKRRAGGLEYMGGWFIKDGAIDAEILTAGGWERTEWVHSDGNIEEGYWRRECAVSVIRMRERWEVYDAAKQLYVFPFQGRDPKTGKSWYDSAAKIGRPSGRLHVLGIVKGIEAAGPVFMTLKGISAQYFQGTKSAAGALATWAGIILRMANAASEEKARAAGQKAGKWPYRAFWLPVGANRNEDGTPKFIKVGKDNDSRMIVIPIALGLPAKVETDPTKREALLRRFFVGAEWFHLVNDLYAQHAEWANAWNDGAMAGKVDTGGDVEPPVSDEQPAISSAAEAELEATGL